MFYSPLSRNGNFGRGEKPIGNLWFSSGSWLFDMHFNKEQHTNPDDTLEPIIIKCVMIKNPINILEINTFKELDDFVNIYCLQKSSPKTVIKEKFMRDYESQYTSDSNKAMVNSLKEKCGELKIDFDIFMNNLIQKVMLMLL